MGQLSRSVFITSDGLSAIAELLVVKRKARLWVPEEPDAPRRTPFRYLPYLYVGLGLVVRRRDVRGAIVRDNLQDLAAGKKQHMLRVRKTM